MIFLCWVGFWVSFALVWVGMEPNQRHVAPEVSAPRVEAHGGAQEGLRPHAPGGGGLGRAESEFWVFG